MCTPSLAWSDEMEHALLRAEYHTASCLDTSNTANDQTSHLLLTFFPLGLQGASVEWNIVGCSALKSPAVTYV